jgi:hypothetical protein
MSCFVISAADTDLVQSDVFSAGPDGAQEAVAAFTDRSLAESYLDASDDVDEGTVVEISDVEFVGWLVDALRDGVDYVAVNPIHEDQLRGRRIETIDIQAQLESAGAKILRVMRPDF